MKKNKILFLDIDGVLNVIPQGWDAYGGTFHKHLVDNLRRIVEETDCKIVISSTWRFSGLKTMKEMWSFRDLPGEVIDITPDFCIAGQDNIYRGHEIKHWIEKNKEKVESYCIIDDDYDMLLEQFPYFVRTFNNHIHKGHIEGYGLTKECADESIHILNEKVLTN